MVVGVTGLFAGPYVVGRVLIAPHRSVSVVPPGQLPPQQLSLRSPSGATLAAWLFAPPHPRGAVLVLHGIRANRGAMLSRAELLVADGYAVLVPDLQAQGESTGERITFGNLEAKDAEAGVGELRRRFAGKPVGAVGVSMGGAALVLAGRRLHLDAAILEAVYPTIAEAVDNRIRRRVGRLSSLLSPLLLLQLEPCLGVGPSQLRPIDAIDRLGCPVLVIGGTRDEHTTEAQTRALYASAREPKELWLVDGAAHVDLARYDPAGYRRRVLGFFREHLSTDPAAAPSS